MAKTLKKLIHEAVDRVLESENYEFDDQGNHYFLREEETADTYDIVASVYIMQDDVGARVIQVQLVPGHQELLGDDVADDLEGHVGSVDNAIDLYQSGNGRFGVIVEDTQDIYAIASTIDERLSKYIQKE